VLQAQASGVQVYVCQVSKEDAARWQWTPSGPQAELFDPAGKKIGKHYAGPTWELDDGSKVVGEVLAKSASPQADAVDWLLLKVKQNSAQGLLGHADRIQRVATSGGKPPAHCDTAQEGKEFRSPYRATYNFFATAK
jgi:hypothetical protein